MAREFALCETEKPASEVALPEIFTWLFTCANMKFLVGKMTISTAMFRFHFRLQLWEVK